MNKQNLTRAVDLIGKIAEQVRAGDKDRTTGPDARTQSAPVSPRIREMLGGLSHSEAREALADVPVATRRQLMRASLRGSVTRSGGTIQIDSRRAPARTAPRSITTVPNGSPEPFGDGAKVPVAPSPSRSVLGQPKGRIRQVLDAAELERLRTDYARYPLVQRHEAGHVIAAWSLGYGVRHVDAGFSGHCGSTQLVASVADPQDALLVLSAGMAAERTHKAWVDDYRKLWPHSDDRARIGEWWSYLRLSVVEEGKAHTRIDAYLDDLLSRHSRVLDDVATELQKRHALGADDLSRLLPRKAIRDDVPQLLGGRQ